jgi:hypothetical protein
MAETETLVWRFVQVQREERQPNKEHRADLLTVLAWLPKRFFAQPFTASGLLVDDEWRGRLVQMCYNYLQARVHQEHLG